MTDELHKIITPDQIRAGRALLNWTQGDLAKRSGLSLRALNSIERGLAVPRLDNLRAIHGALEKANIEFLEFDGVRRRTERLDVLKLEGKTCADTFVADIVQELRATGGISWANIVSEKEFESVSEDVLNEYFCNVAKYNIDERILLPRGDMHILSAPTSYRWIQPEVIGQVAHYVYGDNVAFVVHKKPARVIIMRNPSMADTFRRQFEFNWKQAEVPWFAKRYKPTNPKEPWTVEKARAARAWIEKNKS